MSGRLAPPPRKNPLRRTRLPTLPPGARSRAAHAFTRAAAEGHFALQRCAACGAFAYPAREACPVCLGAELEVVDAPPAGIVLSATTIRIPAEPYFRERAPWRSGLVKLDCGPVMVAHLHGDCREGEAVRLSFQLDKSGQAVAFARPAKAVPDMADDPQWREMVADPRFRRVLVTDGRGAIGQEIAKALLAAGAASVHVGIAQPWKPWPDEAALRAAGVIPVALDPTDEKSVTELAAELGAKVDILVNTGAEVRPGGLIDHPNPNELRDAIERSCLGFVHLARGFGPVMRARGADGGNSAAAWVNLFSVHALANWPAFGAASAAEAACVSLSHCLRAELRPGGVRVVNLFTGPTDTEWFQTLPPPKIAPRAIATALVAALLAGTEDVFVGEVAEDVRRRLAANPKALERELGA